MSDRRDRSSERRRARVQSSRSTNARERSRSPARTTDRNARDRGYETSTTANPYSRRENKSTRHYDSERDDERRGNPYSRRSGETDDSRSSRQLPAEIRPSSHLSDRHESSGSYQRDSTRGGQTRSGTNNYPLGTRGRRSDPGMNLPAAPTNQQGDSGGQSGDRNRSTGGGSWGGFSRTDAPQGGHDNFGIRNYNSDDKRGGGYNGGGYGRGRGGSDRGGGHDRGGRSRGYGGGRGGYGDSRAPAIVEGPPLPELVPVPPNGKELQIPTPQRQGRTGQPIRVLTNHFEIQSLPHIELYQYDIRVTPDVRRAGGPLEDSEIKQCAPAMVNKVMENPEVKNMLGIGFIFDGISIGWSTQKLPFPTDPFRYRLELPGSRPGRTFGCNIDIHQSGRFSTEPFVQWLRNESQRVVSLTDPAILSTEDHIQLCLKFLNALLRSDPSKRFATGQGNKSTTYFDRTPATTVALRSTGSVLEAWRGFYQTATVRFGKLTVNVDTTTNAFIKPGISFLDVIAGFAGLSADQVEGAFLQNRDDLTPIMKKLIGVGFKVRHLEKSPKSDTVRRVMRMTAHGASGETFERRKFHKGPVTGEDTMTLETVTVAKYYSQQYNINIRFLKLPMAESRKGEKYPLELCFVSDSERWKETLQGAETADFIKFATGPAYVRKGQIEENLKRLAWHNQGELKEFGVSINPQFMNLEARVLPAPIPLYKRGTEPRAPSGGRWNLRGKTFHTAQKVTGWGLMYFPGGNMRLSEERLREFAENCNFSFSTYGMDVKRQDPTVSTANQQGDLKRSIREMLLKISQKGSTPNLMVFLLSSTSAEPYTTIKKICDVDLGIASQCMIVEKAFNPKRQQQYLGNISMKVNIKLGGINAWINDPVLVRGPTIVMGCDASYPNASQLRMSPPLPTFTAIAANYDKHCAKYSAVTNSQDPGKEEINRFGRMALELINRFEKHSGCKPETILYFRDGLSEGGFGSVLKAELSELKAVTRAKITIILCVKRHHTRIFPGPGDLGDNLGNVAPGTVVENGNGRDIFLVSHSGLQGTVRPTHYIALYDESNFTPDQLHGLCNNLCYGYGRATVSVSIVPPIYYARLACERARMHVESDGMLSQVNKTLVKSMWWQ